MSNAAPGRNEGGFALALVVLMLFAIAMAGVTGYQVVSSEFALAQQNRDGQKALAVARAGLNRFVAEQIGQIGLSASYAIGDGVATVTAKRVLTPDSMNHLYHLKAVGTVADPRTPLLPSERTVTSYAWHRIGPIPHKGSFWISHAVRFSNSIGVTGADDDPSGTCPWAGAKAGLVRGGSVNPSPSGGGYVSGSPQAVSYAGYSAFKDTVGVRWDILTDPSFPVDFDGYYPNFLLLPPDSFPVTRYTGNHTAGFTVGRGVLIVSGTLSFSWFFNWDGIVLAGELNPISSFAGPNIRGMMISGLNGSFPEVRLRSGDFRYDSCKAWKANKSLSYLELVDNALVEPTNF